MRAHERAPQRRKNPVRRQLFWGTTETHVRRDAMKLTNAFILGSGCRLDGQRMQNVRWSLMYRSNTGTRRPAPMASSIKKSGRQAIPCPASAIASKASIA